MSTPTDGELSAIVDGPDPFDGLPLLAQLWLKPIRGVAPVLKATKDKPIGQFTMEELLAWAATLTYLFTSAALAGQLAGNLLRVAVRGR